MLIIFLIILIIIFFVAICKDFDGTATAMLCGIFGVLILIGLCLYTVIDSRNIQPKIDMYEAENEKIENEISVLVSQYMKYEGDTVDKVSNSSSLMLVNLYPDLKSSELVNQQLIVHLENSNKIKELKEELISSRNARWWLYFGGGE